MTETWQLLRSEPGTAATNMAVDEALLQTGCARRMPVLRFYSWTEPAATFGYFQKYADIEPATPLRPLVRRPTGGGLVPHDRDWTYSLAFPAGHWWYRLVARESYRLVHLWLRTAFAIVGVPTDLAPCCRKDTDGQCFAGYEQHDLLWHGRKIAGAAQRRTRDGLLIQGSVQAPSTVKRADWEEALCREAQRAPDPAWPVAVDWVPFAESEQYRQLVAELARGKYARDEFNTRR